MVSEFFLGTLVDSLAALFDLTGFKGHNFQSSSTSHVKFYWYNMNILNFKIL